MEGKEQVRGWKPTDRVERLVMYVTGIGNIRDVLPFPRTTGSAEF